jgi:nucleoside phosphorylase
MEAYALLAAAEEAPTPRPTAFVIESICGFADEEKDDTFQEYAAYTSSRVLAWLVEECL